MKTSFSLLSVLFLFLAFTAHSQTGWKWAISGKQPNGAVYDMGAHTIDHSGNIIMAGHYCDADTMNLCGTTISFSTSAVWHPFITKTDSAHHLLWYVKGTASGCYMQSVVTDDSNNVYLLGTYNPGTLTIGSFSISTSGSDDHFIAKISASGTPLWLRSVGFWAGHLAIDNHGSPYLFCAAFGGYAYDGISYSFPDSSVSVGIAKFDSSGTAIQLSGIDGGYGDINIAHATISPNGTIYVTGIFSSARDTAHRKFYFGSSVIALDTFTYERSFVAKIKSDGTPEWAIPIDDSTLTWHIKSDWKDNFYLTGYFNTHAAFGSTTLSSHGGKDAFIAKYDSTGAVKWAKSQGGEKDEWGWEIALDSCGTAWMGGWIGYAVGGASFDADTYYSMYLDTSVLHPQPNSFDPIFVARYDSSGNYISGFTLPSCGDDPFLLQCDGFGNLYVGGDLYRSTTVIGSDTFTCSDTVSEYFFLARYNYTNSTCHPLHQNSTNDVEKLSQIAVYPNPVQSILTIESPEKINSVNIVNLLGQVVHLNGNRDYKMEINTSDLPSGLYCVRINESIIAKIIKE